MQTLDMMASLYWRMVLDGNLVLILGAVVFFLLWDVFVRRFLELVLALFAKLISKIVKVVLTYVSDVLAGLSVHELGIEVLSQASDIDAGSGRVRHILDVVLSVLDPLGRRIPVEHI